MLGFEVSPIVQYVIAFAIIAILLALFAFVLKRIGGNRFAMGGAERGRGRQPRLGIVDVYDLDRQRQLVLLRRDNVEHLVMLGGTNDFVVESNIVRMPAGRATMPAAQAGDPAHAYPAVADAGAQPMMPQTPRYPAPPVAPQPAEPQAPAPQAQPPHPMPPRPAQSATQAPQAPVEAPIADPALADTRLADAPLADAPLAGEPPAASPAPPAPDGVTRGAPQAFPVEAPPPRPAATGDDEPTGRKRGLFGFGRSGDAPADAMEESPKAASGRVAGEQKQPAPQFPPRPRTTPVAPATPPPYPPPRSGQAAQPAGTGASRDLTAGLAAALTGAGAGAAAGVTVAAGAGARAGDAKPGDTSDEATGIAAAVVTAREPSRSGSPSDDAVSPETPPAQADEAPATAGGDADLEKALLSDMARELEAAFQRQEAGAAPRHGQAEGAPPDEAETAAEPAFVPVEEPDRFAAITTPAPQPVFPARTAPVVEETVPEAEQMRHPHVPEPGMTPPPTTGPAYFAPVVDEAVPPREESRMTGEAGFEARAPGDDQSTSATGPEPAQEAQEAQEDAHPALSDSDDATPPATPFPAMTAAEAASEPAAEAATEPSDDTIGKPGETDDLTSETPETAEPEDEPQEAMQETLEETLQAALQETLEETPAPEPEAAPEPVADSPAQDAQADKTQEDKPHEEKAEEEQVEEPKSKVDPFSVDEIEAEFARLLGRSVDKDPKSS